MAEVAAADVVRRGTPLASRFVIAVDRSLMRLVTLGTGTVALTAARVCAGHLRGGGRRPPAARLRQRRHAPAGASSGSRGASSRTWRSRTFTPTTSRDFATLVFAWKYGDLPGRSAPLVLIGPVGHRDAARASHRRVRRLAARARLPARGARDRARRGASRSATARRCAPRRSRTRTRAWPIPIERGGRRIVYTGDTGYDPMLAEWARGTDVLLCECSLPDDDGDPDAPHARAVRRARGGGAAEASRAHAFLSTRRARRHPRARRRRTTPARSRWPTTGPRSRSRKTDAGRDAARRDARRRSRASSRSSRRWAIRRARCPARSARRSASSATTDASTARSSRRSTAWPRSSTSRKPYKQVSREWRPENTLVTIAPGVVVRRRRRSRSSPARARWRARSRSCSPRAQVRDGGRRGAARRRVQAAQLAVLVPGARQEGARAARARARARRGCRSSPRRWTRRARTSSPKYADCIQIGARNMQNYSLLQAVGRLGKPVLLKRGMAATINDLLHERRVHPRRGQHAGDPLRARHPQLRQRDAQPVRPHGDPARAEAVAPARSSPTRATAPGCATR